MDKLILKLFHDSVTKFTATSLDFCQVNYTREFREFFEATMHT
jgi:hypothetical protein